MDETISIGCKLPHGLVLEIGVNKDGTPGESYRNAVLQGTVDARKGAKYGVTKVPRDLWLKWLANNKNLRYVVDLSVFVVT